MKHGDRGADSVLDVPVGTQVWVEGNPPKLAADLAEPGQWIVVAKGGRGGRGNRKFTSSTNRFPLLAEEGEQCAEVTLRLELKLLADVGIIGAPNAGKSSLLAAVTAARPEIAGYPFTTLEPALGVVDSHADSFLMVDIPGIIEGAHKGTGLGHDFLRHVERTSVLIHVVDGSAEDPIRDYDMVTQELHLFSRELLNKPQMIAINKIDIPEARERMDKLASRLPQETAPVHLISAATREGLEPLLDSVLQVLNTARKADAAKSGSSGEELPVLRPRPRREPVEVNRDNGEYVVRSAAAARIAAMVDETNWEARTQFYRHLKHLGVIKALEESGVASGDTVRIGKLEWEWG